MNRRCAERDSLFLVSGVRTTRATRGQSRVKSMKPRGGHYQKFFFPFFFLSFFFTAVYHAMTRKKHRIHLLLTAIDRPIQKLFKKRRLRQAHNDWNLSTFSPSRRFKPSGRSLEGIKRNKSTVVRLKSLRFHLLSIGIYAFTGEGGSRGAKIPRKSEITRIAIDISGINFKLVD